MEPVNQQKQLYYKTYSDALCTNEAQTSQWTVYRQDHVELKENLQMYRNAPKADILIPIGTKAFIPGQLYQTGEVIVSHGCGYFSECSSEQAESIADRRIHLANELLQNYERERSLYNDKLEVPLASEAFALENSRQEIIEAYDEEAEKLWRVEHRRLVRENKQREAKERAARRNASQEISDEKLFTQLNEMELLEELENEMDQLDLPIAVDDDDLLGRLMRGETRLNERTRKSHKQTESIPESECITNVHSSKLITADILQQNKTYGSITMREELEEQSETTDDDEDDVTFEFSKLLNETKNSTNEEKIKTFHTKLKEVRRRLYENSLDIMQKVELYQLHEELEEVLEFLLPLNESVNEQAAAKWETLTKQDSDKVKQAKLAEYVEEQSETKLELIKIKDIDNGRKVQFAEQEQIKFIINRHQEHPGQQTFFDPKNTLFLPVKHMESTNYCKSDSIDEIVSPADIYRKFLADEVFYKQSQFSDLKPILKNHKLYHPSPERLINQSLRKHDSLVTSKSDLLGEVVEHTSMDLLKQETNVLSIQQSQQKKKMSRFKQQRN